LLGAGSAHTFVLVVDNHTAENGTLPDGVEKIVIQTSEPMGAILDRDGRRSAGDIWAMTNGLRGQDFDAFFFPTLHTYFPLMNRTKKLVAIHDVLAEKYPDLVMRDPGLRRFWRFKSWLARRQADAIVTVSEYSKGQLATQFGLAPEKIWVVPQAIDPMFNPMPYSAAMTQTLTRFGLDSTSRFVVYLGGLAPHKNLETLLKVFGGLSGRTEFMDVDLVLIGPEEGDILPDGTTLRDRVDGLGLERAVTITGYLDDKTVAHLLTAASVMVLPSIEEGFGLGAVEAAACGTAVIATRNSPLPDLLGEAGVFVDTTNTAELEVALVDLLVDDEKRGRMGMMAREKARGLDWGNSAERFLDYLESAK
jgi:glycosyltransferase involved in cell wall biosynthesis